MNTWPVTIIETWQLLTHDIMDNWPLWTPDHFGHLGYSTLSTVHNINYGEKRWRLWIAIDVSFIIKKTGCTAYAKTKVAHLLFCNVLLYFCTVDAAAEFF